MNKIAKFAKNASVQGAFPADPKPLVDKSSGVVGPDFAAQPGARKLVNANAHKPLLAALMPTEGVSAACMATKADFHWIGGAGDKTPFMGVFGPTGIMKDVARGWGSASDNYWGHEDANAIVEHVLNSQKACGTDKRIVLVGHSWGGATAKNVTDRLKNYGIMVDKLITLDPVSLTDFTAPNNQREWINIYQKQSALDYIATVPLVGQVAALVFGFLGMVTGLVSPDDFIATLGGQWGHESKANKNIELHIRHERASAMMEILTRDIPDVLDPRGRVSKKQARV